MKAFLIVGLVWLAAATLTGCGRQVEIIAHRGASYLAPENSMSAVMLGWDKGADVEVDVYLSKDGRIVVNHDKTTERTGDKNFKISETNWEQLRTVDVGSFKSADFAGETMPLLDDVVATIPEGRKLYVEIKCGEEILPHLEKVIDASGKRSQIVIIAFDFNVITAAKKLMPDVEAYWLMGSRKDKVTQKYMPHDVSVVEEVAGNGLEGIDVHYGGVTKAFVRAVRQAGLELYVWTVDDPAEAVRLIELGVDGITTNRPEWLKERVVNTRPF